MKIQDEAKEWIVFLEFPNKMILKKVTVALFLIVKKILNIMMISTKHDK